MTWTSAGTWVVRPIGTIQTPFHEAAGTPIQPAFAHGAEGEVLVFDEFEAGLADLDGFERIWLIYTLDRARPYQLTVVPYLDSVPRGVFATRAPSRPNPIGLSAVRLLARTGTRLRVTELDMLDGTPLLDIKPYVPRFDAHPDSRSGWLPADTSGRGRADDRFHRE